MLGHEWAGGLASLANCHKKMGSPLQNHESPEQFGKAQRKKKETCVCFLLHANILYYNSNN